MKKNMSFNFKLNQDKLDCVKRHFVHWHWHLQYIFAVDTTFQQLGLQR